MGMDRSQLMLMKMLSPIPTLEDLVMNVDPLAADIYLTTLEQVQCYNIFNVTIL